jgi:chemotaxis protein methyltransferase WspC
LPFPISAASNHASAAIIANSVRKGNGAAKHEAASLKLARRHADAGRLKEAAAICESHLKEQGASAEAYYLLGLVLDANSDPKAIEYYRKALYLEPDHYETLLQMAVLSQRNGDRIRADRYKRRAKRAAPTYKLEI